MLRRSARGSSEHGGRRQDGSHDYGSLAERLRGRRKASYKEVAEEDSEEGVEGDSAKGGQFSSTDVANNDAATKVGEYCSVCSDGGELLCCDTCPNVYHLRCMDPPLKAVPKGRWSCPKCCNPLNDLDKFLDWRLIEVEAPDNSKENRKVIEVLVKWKSRSYLHASWVRTEDIEKASKDFHGLRTRWNHYRRNQDCFRSKVEDEDGAAKGVRTEWVTVDRVIASRGGKEDSREYLVKWKELGYDEATWENVEDLAAFQAEIARYEAIESRADETYLAKENDAGTKRDKETGKKRKNTSLERLSTKRQRRDFDSTPKFLKGGNLYDYQLGGLNWLRFAWQKRKHVILADEMGLGKTVQAIAFLASVKEERGPGPPFVVVAPLSTLRNWEREFATWAPHLNVVMYVGNAQARAVIRQYEFYYTSKKGQSKKKKLEKKKQQEDLSTKKQERIKFDVLLTSYEMISFETSSLKNILWECLIVDEGHRLKCKESKLFQLLHNFKTRHRVLLTGTPLQNNLDELFMLMHFLDPTKFDSLESFQEEFRDIGQEEQVGRLHKMLAPHLLRRLKRDVLKDMPPKKELIVRVELSPLQRSLYKAVLTRNFEVLSRHRQGAHQMSLNNVVMELRKVCGHPYLIDVTESTEGSPSKVARDLVEASGKLELLDKMMEKLREQGHRVLIYSQFTKILDILEDWLSGRDWGYERIDGSVGGMERQIRIDRFNAPDSTRFCFLLSTRAGGLGINLATADTVVIYDSDWNPHADLQAMARAHRLGQKGTVMIYRLITRGSIEERMMQLTKKKLVLEHVVVGRMKTSQLNQVELDDILRYGSAELFAEEEAVEGRKSRRIQYDSAAIESLLDRTQVEHEEEAIGDMEESDYLKAFKVANFEYVDEEEAAAAAAEEAAREAEADRLAAELTGSKRAAFWDQLLRDKYESKQIQKSEELGKGKRARKQVNYSVSDPHDVADVPSEDAEEEASLENPSSSDSGRTADSTAVKETKKVNIVLPPGNEDAVLGRGPVARKKSRMETESVLQPEPLMDGAGLSLRVLGFNQQQRGLFLNLVLRFGLGDSSWKEFVPRMKTKSLSQIKQYGLLFLNHLTEGDNSNPCFSDGVPKEGLKAHEVLRRIGLLHVIRKKVEMMRKNSLQPFFKLPPERLTSIGPARFWKEEHDYKLLQAIIKYGYGRWHDAAFDVELGLCEVLRRELNLSPYESGPMNAVQPSGEKKGGHASSEASVIDCEKGCNPLPIPLNEDGASKAASLDGDSSKKWTGQATDNAQINDENSGIGLFFCGDDGKQEARTAGKVDGTGEQVQLADGQTQHVGNAKRDASMGQTKHGSTGRSVTEANGVNSEIRTGNDTSEKDENAVEVIKGAVVLPDWTPQQIATFETKKIVDWVKKRVTLLAMMLNEEYHSQNLAREVPLNSKLVHTQVATSTPVTQPLPAQTRQVHPILGESTSTAHSMHSSTGAASPNAKPPSAASGGGGRPATIEVAKSNLAASKLDNRRFLAFERPDLIHIQNQTRQSHVNNASQVCNKPVTGQSSVFNRPDLQN